MSSEGQQLSFRRMAISDLLLLILVESAYLACAAPRLHAFRAMPAEAFRQPRLLAITPLAFDYLGLGLVLFGLIVLACERPLGRSLAGSPGHWYFFAMGPITVYLWANGWLPQQASGRWATAHSAFQVAAYGAAALVGVKSVVSIRPLQWRVVFGLLTIGLVLVAILAGYRLVEVLANGGFQSRLQLIAVWGTISIATSAAAWMALIADSLRGSSHDWLTVVALVAMTLNSLSVAIAFWPIMVRFWVNFFSHLLA